MILLIESGYPAIILGLIIVAVGAAITARGVIVSESRAEEIAGEYWDENLHLKRALLHQSKLAQAGLRLISFGTVLQIVGCVQQVLPMIN